MYQMKEQEKNLQKKELNQIEAHSLPDMEFKTLLIRMFNELGEEYT